MKLIEELSQVIFEEDRFFNQCHASTVLKYKDRLLCAFFAGTKEGSNDVRIYLSVFNNGIWQNPRQISPFENIPCWNPVLFESNGIITLFFKAGKKISKWQTYVMTSTDGGDNWSEVRELVPGDKSGGRGPVKNKPVLLSDGRIAAPGSVETSLRWDAFVDISSDGGITWTKSNMMNFDHSKSLGKGIIQPTLWESDREIHALLRSSESRIMHCISLNGTDWSRCEKTELPSNNSGIDCVKLKNSAVIIVYNPIAADWGDRNIIAYSLTHDNGKSFSAPEVIEYDGNTDAEFSYPAVITDDEFVYLTYTHYRKSIMFKKFKIEQ